MCASYLIFIAVAYACACVFFSHDQTHRPRRIAIILGSAVVAWVLAHALKDVIAHPRPDGSLALLVPNDGYSFPSGHATFMFALAFAMSSFDKRASIHSLFLRC